MFNHTACQTPFVQNQPVGSGQTGADFFSDLSGLPGRLFGVGIEFAKHHHKLITTKARHGVDLAHTALESPGYFDQQQIAGRMSMLIVQGLEIIQIHKHQRAIEGAALARQQGLAQSIIEQSPIRRMGQSVIKRQLAQAKGNERDKTRRTNVYLVLP